MVKKSDMCATFAQNAESLFRLSFLITGEESQAESCFAQALEAALASSATVVSDDFAISWARRVVIKTSLGNLALHDQADHHDGNPEVGEAPTRHAQLGEADRLRDGLLSLKPLLRAAFVLRYLERLSKRDIALLLDISPASLNPALQSALAKLGEWAAAPGLFGFADQGLGASFPHPVNT